MPFAVASLTPYFSATVYDVIDTWVFAINALRRVCGIPVNFKRMNLSATLEENLDVILAELFSGTSSASS